MELSAPIPGPGWEKTTNNGVPARAIVDSLMGPEGAASGNVRTISGTSAQTAAITGEAVDLCVDTACWVEIGSNPTAALNTSYYLPANTVVRFPITSGNKIAVIGTTGNLYYHPVQ